MRTLVVLFVLGACGGSTKPASEPTPAGTGSLLDCSKVGDHVATTVAANRPRAGATHGAVKEMVTTRCSTDVWSDETRQCLYAMTTLREGRACATGMTDDQLEALRAHARKLRGEANDSADNGDNSADWIRHVVEE